MLSCPVGNQTKCLIASNLINSFVTSCIMLPANLRKIYHVAGTFHCNVAKDFRESAPPVRGLSKMFLFGFRFTMVSVTFLQYGPVENERKCLIASNLLHTLLKTFPGPILACCRCAL